MAVGRDRWRVAALALVACGGPDGSAATVATKGPSTSTTTMAEGPASEGTSGDPSGTAGGDPSTAGDDTSTEGAAPPDDRLPASAYECGAPGPFVAPPRPYRGLCHLDPACRSPLVVAHRIAPAFAPENSLAALRAAILLGVDVAESDIRVTADGHAVLLHDDADFERMTAVCSLRTWRPETS